MTNVDCLMERQKLPLIEKDKNTVCMMLLYVLVDMTGDVLLFRAGVPSHLCQVSQVQQSITVFSRVFVFSSFDEGWPEWPISHQILVITRARCQTDDHTPARPGNNYEN